MKNHIGQAIWVVFNKRLHFVIIFLNVIGKINVGVIKRALILRILEVLLLLFVFPHLKNATKYGKKFKRGLKHLSGTTIEVTGEMMEVNLKFLPHLHRALKCNLLNSQNDLFLPKR